jgi:solute:Na+ symporter, SSS family
LQSSALNSFDLSIIGAYFLATILIGYLLRKRAHSSKVFFHASRSLPTAVTTIAFVAANCGALEIVGLVSASAKYGAGMLHFYWIGAIPAMLFLALAMMPVYIGSGALTVPEFLHLRFSAETRLLNIFLSTIMMVLVSGISLYALTQVLRIFLGHSFTQIVFPVAAVVLLYLSLGGLTATIYNEVLQFTLIVAGLSPLVFFVLHDFHGTSGLFASLPTDMRHTWLGLPIFAPQTARFDIFGISMGLGFVLSFGYWCTDFVLIQRSLAARSVEGAIETPLYASLVKIIFPLLVVVPGLSAAIFFRGQHGVAYDQALPALMTHYYRHGLLGFGITAILASLMSGVAGNISALTTIWVHDFYRPIIAPNRSDRHYMFAGRLLILVGILLSVATAYVALSFNNLMDYLQLLFSLFNAPLFASFLLGMFTTWATPKAGFWGLLIGTLCSIAHNLAYQRHQIVYGSDMSANFYGATFAFLACLFATTAFSLVTTPKNILELADLTYWTSRREHTHLTPFPILVALFSILLCAVLSFVFR